MSSRKVVIKTKEKNLLGILKDLGMAEEEKKFLKSSDVYLMLNLPDTKDTYEYLSKSGKILNWEIEDSNDKDTEPDDSGEELDIFTEYLYNLVCQEDSRWVGLTYILEGSWCVSKKSPGIVFGTDLFMEALEKEFTRIEKENTSIERAVLFKIIESYYAGNNLVSVIFDLKDKISKSWKSLSQCQTLTSVSMLLFKSNG